MFVVRLVLPEKWKKGINMNIISLNNGKKLNIEKKETYRYLGYHFDGEVPLNDELEKMVNELTEKLKDVITPRCAYEIYGFETDGKVCRLLGNGTEDEILRIESVKLSAHLKDCNQAILFAATIGPGADTMIRRYSGRSSVKPAILQAVGAAAIEAYADEVTEQIKETYPRLRMRFSPGYGDFSLEHQKDFFRLLSLEKNLGISLNQALLMTPTKSITAIIGVI